MNYADRFGLMVRQLCGLPLPPIPRKPGRMRKRRRVLTRSEILSHADPPKH